MLIISCFSVIVPPEDYLLGLAELCKQHNVLFIADEIQTGLGRCGYPLYHQKFGVRPDLVVLGKALSGGMHGLRFTLFDYVLTRPRCISNVWSPW
jgi:ornithine--oxo-acid transaminase